jgi:ParB family chromosome partitioning protein
MATAIQKIILAGSRDIPFNKLLLSQSNVRRVKAGVSIEELAEDIARRGLLQGLSVRAVIDADGVDTGMFEIPAGGRRYRALELLVKQKRLAKTAPVPCIVRTSGVAEEDSLAENIQRAPLHPLDQFRAFLALREKGQSEEEIAATFFVSVAVVKQRLKLASVSPKLLDVYAEDGMTLDQLMAFTISHDHARQEQVFERLTQSYDKQPYMIRRWLTEGAVRAADKRAQFIGLDAYVEAGGCVMRDLFQGDDGGWLQDVALVDLMASEKLREEAARIASEGWKWIEVATDFPYGHSYGLRRLRGETVPLSPEEEATRDALQAELNAIEADSEAAGELTDEQDARASEIEAALETLNVRPVVFDPEDVARAGAFVSIDRNGRLLVERGYVRPEDEAPVVEEAGADVDEDGFEHSEAQADPIADPGSVAPVEPEEEDGIKPLPDRLVSELTAYRTLALRAALLDRPDIARLAVLHALTLKVFYHHAQDSCLDLDLRSVAFPAQTPGLADSKPATALTEARTAWATALPKDPDDLWATLGEWDTDSRDALFAFVAAQAVNAVIEPYARRPRAIAHADAMAQVIGLDCASAGWTATADNYLGRVTKARILAAVAEARGQQAADRLAHLKKGEMVAHAESLLADTGWLAEPLRTPGQTFVSSGNAEATVGLCADHGDDHVGATGDDAIVQSAAVADEPAMVTIADLDDDALTADAPLAAE